MARTEARNAKAERVAGWQARAQRSEEANTVPKRGGEGGKEGGRESLGKWFPSPKAIKHLHFCREGIKFLRDLESFPRVSTCKKDVPGYFADEQVLGK